MASQHHLIKRQILQITVQEAAGAYGLQQKLGLLTRNRLTPLIARHCSELSSLDVIHRIDSVEVDLGELPLEDLEEALIKRFDTEFRRKLGEAIAQQSASRAQGARKAAHLELFAYFAQSGTFPWWADTAGTGILDNSVVWLVSHVPEAFKPLVNELLAQESYRKRLIQHLSNGALVTLAGLYSRALGAFVDGVFEDLYTVLLSIDGLKAFTVHWLRFEIWSAILLVLRLSGTASSDGLRFIQTLLPHIASHQGIRTSLLVDRMLEATKRLANTRHRFASDLPAILSAIHKQDAISEKHSDAHLPGEPEANILLKPEADVDLPATLSAIHKKDAFSDTHSDAHIPGEPEANILSEPEISLDFGFSDADEAYITNAGLVILWPFLARFFERLGLLERGQFKDFAALHRAVHLLQFLADPQQEPPPEYLLLLNKVLCGMAVDEVFDFGLPVTEHENDECSSFLAAVIEQAPILHNMSIPGFRATFLLRKGQLSARDGAWLLRVERETYDVVLDRFPWSVAWVKLPWMEAPMQVEW
jgi:hypothetical protein